MTSDKKSEANRRNARKSTGPRTPAGKAAVRLNALKHGLLSKEIRLPGEERARLSLPIARGRGGIAARR